jgi:4a-hydroxytetrahydrobiopterin dehydratase
VTERITAEQFDAAAGADISVPHDQAVARVAAAIAAGGHLVTDEHAPVWWTLADAEGNEVDVATMLGRG